MSRQNLVSILVYKFMCVDVRSCIKDVDDMQTISLPETYKIVAYSFEPSAIIVLNENCMITDLKVTLLAGNSSVD